MKALFIVVLPSWGDENGHEIAMRALNEIAMGRSETVHPKNGSSVASSAVGAISFQL